MYFYAITLKGSQGLRVKFVYYGETKINLLVISKLFEKLPLKRLKIFTNIPDFQFRCQNFRYTINQNQRYCPPVSPVFLDVSQVFDRVFHQDLSISWPKYLVTSVSCWHHVFLEAFFSWTTAEQKLQCWAYFPTIL